VPDSYNESQSGRGQSSPLENWDHVVLPCGHFVNYHSDGSNLAPISDQTIQWVRVNIEETMAVLTRWSFDESHRQPIFLLGGIPALAELIQVLFLISQKMAPIFKRTILVKLLLKH
jgi:hypothetical protein